MLAAIMMESYLPYLFFALTWAVLLLVLLPMPEIWRGLKRLAPRLLARPRIARAWERGRARMGTMHAYLPTMTILAIGIATTLMIGEDFVELAVLLRQQSPLMLDVDQMVYRWAASMRSDPATLFFLTFTHIGGPASLAVIVLGVAAFLFVRQHRGLALYVAVTGSMAGLINLLRRCSPVRGPIGRGVAEGPRLLVPQRTRHGLDGRPRVARLRRGARARAVAPSLGHHRRSSLQHRCRRPLPRLPRRALDLRHRRRLRGRGSVAGRGHGDV